MIRSFKSRRSSFFTARRPLRLRGRLPGVSAFQRRAFRRMSYVPLVFGQNPGTTRYLFPHAGPVVLGPQPQNFIGPLTQATERRQRYRIAMLDRERRYYDAWRNSQTAYGLQSFSFYGPSSSSTRSQMARTGRL